MPKSLSTLEIRANLVDIGLVGFYRGSVAWEGDHVRLVLLHKDSKGLSKAVVAQISACLRKIGCRCVLDETCPAKEAVHVVLIGFLSKLIVWMSVQLVCLKTVK